MADNIDLATITDVNQLKALAYDQIGLLQQVQNNLNEINARINELTQPALNGTQPKVAAKR